MEGFKNYQKKAIQAMRPYVPGEDLTGISVSPEDAKLPTLSGGFIAVNAHNPNDKWYVSKQYHEENYVLAEEQSEIKTELNFGQAVHAAKQGKKIARSGWNGKGMFAFLVQGSAFQVNRPPLNEFYEEGTTVIYRPHIDLKAVDGTIGVWNPNMMDILAEDWVIVE